MRIGFIGAGKIGFTLGKYFTEHNAEISGYYSRREESAKEASKFTHTRYYRQLKEIVSASDALFLTCPDDALEEVWNSLRQYSLKGKCICHCSGALSSAVFSEIGQMEAFGYSIHPLFAIHSKTESYREISKAFFTIEGHERYLDYWKDFFESLGNPVRVIAQERKVLYHAAAVFASNLVCALYAEGTKLMEQCGFDGESAEKALAPLFLNNAKSLAELGPKKALTGPLERADLSTIMKHLNTLPKEEKEIYQRLSVSLLEVAELKNPQRNYSEIRRLLTE